MIRVLNLRLKWLLLAITLFAGFSASTATAGAVETYVDQAVPLPPSPMSENTGPLKPGDLTMQDILNSSVKPKPTKPAVPAKSISEKVLSSVPTSPQIKAPSPQASAGTLLMQGLQTALDEQVSSKTAAAPLQATDVAKGISSAPLPDATPGKMATGSCVPQISKWSKTCVEAGYPVSYVGQIKGETRTTCPQGNLQDVWISNGCVPPEGGQAFAPTELLTSPTAAVAESPVPSTAAVAGSSESVDASCGSSNGLATNSHPVYDLCAAGKASTVAGEGPWHWECKGLNGGMTVSCAAPVAAQVAPVVAQQQAQQVASAPVIEDAQCGSANGVVADTAPVGNLCAKGAASAVNGAGPWTWACSGSNGGRAAACGAPKKTDGLCGSANNSGTNQMPTANLCAAGYASAVNGNGPWDWTCSGLNGGQAATCSASRKLDAVCGPASLSGHSSAPQNALCSVGQAGAVNGDGPWSWTCEGITGGASVSCESRVSHNGTCGSANGASVTETPDENLCASGKSSRVVGNGPWSWTCSGSDGGDTASCTAMRSSEPVATAEPQAPAVTPQASEPPVPAAAPVTAVAKANLCGAASELVAVQAPEKNLCKSGSASSVSGKGPWKWTCSEGGQKSTCETLSLVTSSTPDDEPVADVKAAIEPQIPSCGSANGQGATQEPSSDLCSFGKASSVKGRGPWTWSCTKGKSQVTCNAAKISDGVCGAANGSIQRHAPTGDLCRSGSPTLVQGTGPWLWTCVGTGGGASTSCSATSQAQTRVDGTCGAASNAAASATPAANLCDSGVASGVYGEGPWTWTCSGLNGGIAASCSAQKNTPPAPPPPGPTINGLCGSANGVAMLVQPMDNLCSTGTATAVSGQGPWNWNCLAENGGMTVSCTAPLQPPAPISGVCGEANGVPTLTTPKSGLCSGGISSAVSGKGPWTWSCSGVNGGSAVGCVAPLAGSSVGSLPSMTVPVALTEPAMPQSSSSTSTTKKGLVTPRLPSGTLPPLTTGTLPPVPQVEGMAAPLEAPQLPPETEGITPPPIRDTIQPSPALITNDAGNVLPGNHFVLSEDISTITFAPKSDNYDAEQLPALSKLATVLAQNSGVRITLTAYADNSGTTPREARRLSLSRALTVRDYLTTKGISSSRIDVRALGANVPSGPPDRVDVRAN